jgi:aryl-alcohol dehydrogenase-like predicted oxidoreductase
LSERSIGPFRVPAIGLGCMNLSHAYGTPPGPEDAAKILHRALDLGYRLFDSAALYGFGANETLVGNTLGRRRHEYVLTSKCGMTGVDGKRVIDGRPETLVRTCEESLSRLKTDVIDLYYLHRWDKQVPIEESIGALAALVRTGKIRAIGLSEVSAATLRRAHAVHPIAAVQSEYSLWTRNPEIAVLDACRELGTAFVAFSPLARGFLAGTAQEADRLAPRDIRRAMPRFQGANFAANEKLLPEYNRIAREHDLSPAQLALAWLLTKAGHIVPIPGTTSMAHLEENWAARDARLDTDAMARLDALINARTVSGNRYNDATQGEIDTEN